MLLRTIRPIRESSWTSIQLTVLTLALIPALNRPATAQSSIDPIVSDTVVSNANSGRTAQFQGGSDEKSPVYRIGVYPGEGVTNRKSYLSLNMLKPIWLTRGNGRDTTLGFFDARLAVLDSEAAGNLGLGVRHYRDQQGRVWGFNLWFDLDNTTYNTFKQIGAGFETYTRNTEVTLNGYFPVDDRSMPYAYTPLLNEPFYRNSFIWIPRFRLEEQALTGFDLQMGARLPSSFARRHDVWLYGGYYHFDSEHTTSMNGFSARVQGQIANCLQLQFMLVSDNKLDTNFMAGLVWDATQTFHGIEVDRGYLRNRMKKLIQRNQFVAKETVRYEQSVQATNPVTGNPYIVRHFNSGAPAGGDGTFENPFNMLGPSANPLQTGTDDLLVLHADSVFTGQNLVLQDNQQALGELGSYLFNTNEIGVIGLPRATTGTAAPRIFNSTGASVELANNNQVQGLDILTSTGSGILADGTTGSVVIANNTITGTNRGIEIRNSAATYAISSTPISTTSGDGILLADNTGTIGFTGTTSITNPADNGLTIQGGSATVNLETLTVTGFGSSAIGITDSGGAVTVANPLTLDNSNGSLAATIAIGNSSGDVTFNDVTITDTDRGGIGLPTIDMSNNSNSVSFGELTVTSDQGTGLRAINVASVNSTGGSINSTNGAAMEINGVSGGDLVFTSLSSTGHTFGVMYQTTSTAFDGSLTVLGDGQNAASGGVINASSTGVLLNTVQDVTLNFLDVTSGFAGVSSANSNTVTVNRSVFRSSTANWTGILVNDTVDGKTGTPVIITDNVVNAMGSNQIGINVINNLTLPIAANISANTVNLTLGTSVGIQLDAIGLPLTSPGDMYIFGADNNTVTGPGTDFIGNTTDATIFGSILVNGVLRP